MKDKSGAKNRIIKIVAITFLVVFMIFSALIGIVDIDFGDSLRIIISHIPFLEGIVDVSDISVSSQLIIWNLRIPRILISALTGAALAVCGVVYQGVFKNPMADPYILGISSGAALGAAIGIVLFKETSVGQMAFITLFAFLGAVITSYLVFKISNINGKTPISTLLLAGVAVSYLLSSLLTLVMVLNRDMMERIMFWTMGSFNGSNWTQSFIVAIVTVVGYIIVKGFSRELDVMTTGDESARSLGVDVEKTKKTLIGISTLMVASCVAVSGIIGFIGLVIPHITRLIFKPGHKVLIPFAAIFGAIFMVLADTIARTFLPLVSSMAGELPVGAVTAVFGAPFFIGLLIKSKRRSA